jgi:hypothetical protein
MSRLLVVLSFLIAVPSLAHAQGVGVTSFNARQYLAGAPAPITAPFSIPLSAVVCNQAPLPVGVPPDAHLTWDDPQNPGMVCVYTDPGTGPLFAKVFGAMEMTLTNLAGTLESPESNRAPFSRAPLAPTSVKVVR